MRAAPVTTNRPSQVRNAGLGFNQGLPYSMCVDEFYGRDADVVLWEMGPMGNDDPEGYEDEIAMRNFFSKDLFPRRPSFFFMGGARVARDSVGILATINHRLGRA